MDKKKTTDFPEWVPPQEKDKSGPIAPATFEPEYRKPKYYFSFFNSNDSDTWYQELYFVNVSGKTVEKVKGGAGGFVGEAIAQWEGKGYENVKNNEAVKINEFHRMYDSDFIKQLGVTIVTKDGSKKQYRCVIGKTSSPTFIILEWDNGELGKEIELIDN